MNEVNELMQRRRALMSAKKYGGKSDMHGWTDGVPYTDIDVVQNEYVNGNNGAFVHYNNWSRTGYIPCNGASRITFAPFVGPTENPTSYNAFYTSDHTFIRKFGIYRNNTTDIDVPENASYFAISQGTSILQNYLNGTNITPYK